EVARGIGCADAVAVAGLRVEASIAVRSARHGSDLGEVAAAAALTSFDAIRGDADVVGGGAPGEVDLTTSGRRGRQTRRSRRRLRVRRLLRTGPSRRSSDVKVARGIGCADAVAVASLRVEASIAVARTGHGRDLGEVAAAATLASLHQIRRD